MSAAFSSKGQERGTRASKVGRFSLPFTLRSPRPAGIQTTFLILLAVLVVPMLLAEAANYLRRFETYSSQERHANLELARAVGAIFDAYVNDILRQELTLGLALAANPLPADQNVQLLTNAARQYPSLRQFFWADAGGRVTPVASVGATNVAAMPYFQQLRSGQGWVVSDLLREQPDGQEAVVIARAIRGADGEFLGMVGGIAEPERLGDVLGVERAGNGAIAVVDGRGELVFRFPPLPETERRAWAANHPLLGEALAGKEAVGTILSSAGVADRVSGRASDRASGQVSALVPIESIGWVASASRPSAEVIAPVVDDLAQEAGMFVVVVAIATLAALLISREVTRPLKRLREEAAALGTGALARPVVAGGPRELRELASSFNMMAQELWVRQEQREQHLVELQRMEEGERFLAEASSVLASSLDYETTLRTVARLMVPGHADVCVVEMVEGDMLRQIAVAGSDPAIETAIREWRGQQSLVDAAKTIVGEVLVSGKPCLVALVPAMQSHLTAREGSPPALRELRLRSLIVVPLLAHGHVIGAISLATTSSDRAFTQPDLALAVELARRSTLAIDNALLYREARDAIKARDEFLTIAAHELKTPLTSLRGYSQMALQQVRKSDSLDAARLRRSIEVIERQSVRLGDLVTQLLDVARLESGKIALDLQVTDLTVLVNSVVGMTNANGAPHVVTVNGPSALPCLADALRIEQVIVNLVDNAVKYSPDGGTIDVEIGESAEGIARLAVRDHGIGIPPEHRARIFDRFYQAHSGKQLGGLGLGLYVSSGIVSMHGGQIEAEFPDDGGTRFVVTLPMRTNETQKDGQGAVA